MEAVDPRDVAESVEAAAEPHGLRDDRATRRGVGQVALDGPGNKCGVALRPVFSSDIGHWDVPELTDPVPSSWKLVESGRLSREGFRRFTFELPAGLHLSMNPAFFAGTSVEAATRSLVG